MEIALVLLAIAAAVLVGAWAADRLGLPAPLLIMLMGIVGSALPFVPELVLDPDVVLLGILPPLLYTAAIKTSLVDFSANRGAILNLSIGLVLFTALGVGLFLSWLLDLNFAVGFAIGAVVAPPDAVAATAVARSIGLPRRIVAVLEGESLVNDATALVSLRTALAAAGLAGAAATEVTVGGVVLDFLWASVGGVLIGLVVALGVAWLRRRISADPTFDTVISFLVPFAAYLPAEELHASGVIAVVTAGLVLGHKSPRIQSGASRISEQINWGSIQFLLENAVFLVIGLQVAYDFAHVRNSDLPASTIVWACVGTVALVLVLRPIWVFPFWAVLSRRAGKSRAEFVPTASVVSWAGMRGVVTLAAALLLPLHTPHRDVLILIAVVVTVATLLIQGTTLPILARALGVRGPDAREDALQTAIVVAAASRAGIESLDGMPDLDPRTREELVSRSTTRVDQFWERLGDHGEQVEDTPGERYRTARLLMLDRERARVLEIRDSGRIDHEVLQTVLSTLDLEESMLERITVSSDELRDAQLSAAPIEAPCAHLRDASDAVDPVSPEGCAECLRDGTSWVHLRLCLTCGHVGCCDSSPMKHASAHFRETGHPVMRSFEPGEAWRWCFVDEVAG